jgi:hypothetical protein
LGKKTDRQVGALGGALLGGGRPQALSEFFTSTALSTTERETQAKPQREHL